MTSSPPPLLLPKAPFTFSILVTSPIRYNLPLSPVGAVILPIATTDARFGSILIGGINFLISFLMKYSLIHPPTRCPNSDSENGKITLTLDQLAQLLKATREGRLPLPSPVAAGSGDDPAAARNQGQGPVGGDQPLFPDNLSVSLSISSAFAPFDGSPDTSFNVPLFEIPGVPGNLILILTLLIAQFMVDQTGIRVPNHQTTVPSPSRENTIPNIPEY